MKEGICQMIAKGIVSPKPVVENDGKIRHWPVKNLSRRVKKDIT